VFKESIIYAVKGSISKSGAWSPFVGTALIWLILWAIGRSDVILPTTIPGAIEFFLSCAGVTWLVVFLGRFLYAPYHFLREARIKILLLTPAEKEHDEIYANVRVADNPELVELFINPSIEHNKLIALLREDKIRSWAKRGSTDNAELRKLDGSIWQHENLTFLPIGSPGTINQTFLKENLNRPWVSPSHSHYEVWLNYAELKKVLPLPKIQIATKDTG
jgi:hypothetical protein